MTIRKAAFALVLPLLGCGSPAPVETGGAATAAAPQGCIYDNGAWCITTPQAAPAQGTNDLVHWAIRDPEDNTGLIVEPESCRGRPADGVYRRSIGTTLREGESWKIARIGFREDRSCEVLFMAPESALASLQTVFLTRVNVCIAGTECGSRGNALAARLGRDGIF